MQARQRRRLNMFRYLVFTIFGLFFLLAAAGHGPVLPGGQPARHLVAERLDSRSCRTRARRRCCPLSRSTLELVVITCVVVLVLLVPTMIWIRLRVQWISRVFEFLCLLPLTIPAIVLVVGLAPVYNRIERAPSYPRSCCSGPT